jgi:hypothetical protein
MNFDIPRKRASGFSATLGRQPVSNSTVPCAYRIRTHVTGRSIISLRSVSGK